MELKILVAAHKKYPMPQDEIYFPLHVGKKGKESIGYTGDDTGDHISDKNPNYCELTGLYWAWKNLDAETIGLAHYRRHFTVEPRLSRLIHGKSQSVLTKAQAEKLLSQTDVILPKKRMYGIETNQSHYAHAHNEQDLIKTGHIIAEKYPEYSPSFERVMHRTSAHMFNMLIMKKDVFDRYCEWLFAVLGKLEHQIDLSVYNATEARVFGYISELLLDVWIDHHQIRYSEIGVMFMEKQNWFVKIGRFILRKFSGGPFANTSEK